MLDSNISRKLSDIDRQFGRERDFWLRKMSGKPVKTAFPYQSTPADNSADCFDTLEFDVAGELLPALDKLTKQSHHRLHLVLTAVISFLLHKYTGNRDIIVGSPIYKQQHDVEFVNTVLPLRNQIPVYGSFKELLMQVKDTVAQANAHQNYPIEKMLEQMDLPAATLSNGFPLFDVAVLIEPIHDKNYIKHIANNITFSYSPLQNQLRASVVYNSSLYPRQFLEQIISHFQVILQQVLTDIDIPLTRIKILTEEQEKEFLFHYNDTHADNPLDSTIHKLFEKQAQSNPDHIAILLHNQEVSYKELNEKSNRLAHFLISKGVVTGNIVAIMAERSVEMLVGILGILKAGAAYLPVSPGFPPKRKNFMIKDGAVAFMLMQEHLWHDNKGLMENSGQIFLLEDPAIYARQDNITNPNLQVAADNPVYIIYTSGSTGKPKGVVLEHCGVINYITWASRQYIVDNKGRFPLYTSFSFDLTVTSIFAPLLSGQTIIVYSGDEREFLIKNVMSENKVDIVKLTPAHLKLIRDLNIKAPEALHSLILGGEDLSAQLSRDILNHFNGEVKIYNEYGPTETVVGSMIHCYDPAVDHSESVPIGVPIDNTQIYLLDVYKKPVPVGVSGKLFISGAGVARGYLNRPELTAEKFIDNPYIPGTKMYDTGDLGKRFIQTNGCKNIQFLGRGDEQVKIRGFRVELGEIENKIREFNRDADAATPQEKTTLQFPEPQQVTRCTQCLLPDNYPGIRFNEQGVCHVCREFEEKFKPHVNRYFKEPADFDRLMDNRKKTKRDENQYDCLLLFSGGKDSTYVLYRLVDMGLKVLALTFDNGYISEAAFRNIKQTTSRLNVDRIIEKVPTMNQVFVESLKANSNVCHGCWHTLNTVAIKVARNQKIPLVVSGLSRGQIFDMRLEGLFQAGIFDQQEIEDKLLSFRKMFHSAENKFFKLAHVELEKGAVEAIQFVDFFRYFNTPVEQIKPYLIEKGWEQPEDTGFCSSNCLINDVGIYMYQQGEGLHFYAAPLSHDIRLGQLSREAGMKEMGFDTDLAEVGRILDEIGYYKPFTVKDAVVAAREDDNHNRSLYAYILPENDSSLSETEIRDFLSRDLPDYMVPANFVLVDYIPLAAGGKVDKKALLKIQGTRLQSNVVYVEPADDKEIIIANLCKELFKLEKIGINDNFFSLGATSFTIIQMTNRLQEKFNKEIPVLTMFEYPTIASFLEYMDLEIPQQESAQAAQEEKEWQESRKEGKNKIRNLRNRRAKQKDLGND